MLLTQDNYKFIDYHLLSSISEEYELFFSLNHYNSDGNLPRINPSVIAGGRATLTVGIMIIARILFVYSVYFSLNVPIRVL